MMTMHWSAQYIGLPYYPLGRTWLGCDCYGLALIVYAERLGIELPHYDGRYATCEERAEINALIADVTATETWQAVQNPKEFDLAVFRRGRLDTHVGIVLRPGLMLHMADEDCAKIERYDTGPWAHRLNGVYRHAERRAA